MGEGGASIARCETAGMILLYANSHESEPWRAANQGQPQIILQIYGNLPTLVDVPQCACG